MILRFSKNDRYYNLYQQRNFFDGTSIICSWGTFNSHRGGHKVILCHNNDELAKAISDISKRRKYRGYTLTQ